MTPVRHSLRFFRRVAAASAIVLTAAVLTPAAHAQSFGTAKDFNLFLFGNHNQSGTDVWGRVAVGGNADYRTGGYSPGMTIGSTLGGSTTDNLIVGGNYWNVSHTVNGNIVVGGNTHWNNPTANGKISSNGNVTFVGSGTVQNGVKHGGSYNPGSVTVNGGVTAGSTTLPIDFAAEELFYNNLSADLAALTNTGSFANPWNNLNIQGTGALTEIITISASALSSANVMNFSGFNSAATVIVNVTGTSITAQNFAMNFGSLNKQNVLFNFKDATAISLTNISWDTTFLAPKATVSTTNGQLNGTLVAKNLTGSMESHTSQFTGIVPSTRIPEPATLALLGIALPFFLRKRKKQGF
jgi:choice-of-anchor A domain-containing protein